MADLTEAMGITKPSLYACFGNKEALFRKALDLYERDKLAYLRTALNESTAKTVAQRLLCGAVTAHCGGDDPQGCLGVMSVVTCSVAAESVRQHVVDIQTTFENGVMGRFEQAMADGDLPADADPRALASCLTTFIQGLSVKAQGGASREQLQAMANAFLAIWPGR